MPKPPPVDYFRITCVSSKEALGETVAALIKLGHTDIHHELVTDVRAFARNSKPEISSRELLTAWVQDHPTFGAIEAVKYFREQGRTNNSAYPAIGDLVEKGILKKLGPGRYARADVKHLAAPKQKTRAKTSPKTFEKTAEEVLLSYAKRNHGRLNTARLTEFFTKEGRSKASVYTALHVLVNRKQIKRVGDAGSGQYVLLNGPAKKLAAKKKPAVSATKTNGGAEVTHG
jgi:hypothetical protein